MKSFKAKPKLLALAEERFDLAPPRAIWYPTELVCFRVQGSNALETLSELGVDVDEVADLPLGSFVAMNVRSGVTLRGKLF